MANFKTAVQVTREEKELLMRFAFVRLDMLTWHWPAEQAQRKMEALEEEAYQQRVDELFAFVAPSERATSAGS